MTNPLHVSVLDRHLPPLMILLFIGMSQSSKNSRSTPKPYYNKHFLRSFKLNYGEAFANQSNDKILCRLHDWNCEWLSRPNIAISEMASTLKDNWTHIMAYRRTVFAESFVHDLRTFVDPITDALRRLDNKDKLDTDPLDADDVVGILKSIYKDPWVEDLFTNAFNAVGPIMMMAVHVLVANCLMQNPDAFAERSVCAPSCEKFKTDLTFQNMMRYLIDSILFRRRNVQRSTNIWDTTSYLQLVEDNSHEARPSRSQRSLAHTDPTAEGSSAGPSTSRRRVTSPSTGRARQNTRPTATTSSRRRSTLNISGIRALADSKDDEDHQPRHARQTSTYRATPVDEDDHFSQDDQASPRRAGKNKRPLNGPMVAKNRQPVVGVGDHEDHEEANMFMTQSTPPLKKQKKTARDPHNRRANLQ